MFKHRRYIILIVSLLSICMLFASCGGGGEGTNTGAYYDPNDYTSETDGGETIPPESAELQEQVAALLTDFASDPNYLQNLILTPDANMRLSEIQITGGEDFEFSDAVITDIYVTGNKADIVYAPSEGSNQNTAHSYVFWGDFGSYTINDDGYNYTYEFDIAESVDTDAYYHEVTVDSLYYDETTGGYVLDAAVLREYIRHLLSRSGNSLVSDDILDNSEFSLMLTDEYGLGEVSTAVGYGTYFNGDISRDLFHFLYINDGVTRSVYFVMSYGVDITVEASIVQNSDYELSVSASVSMSVPYATDISSNFSFSGNITKDDDAYFVPSGFLRDDAILAERIARNAGSLIEQYSGAYYVDIDDIYDPCEGIYVYDKQTGAYIIMVSNGDGSYQYSGLDLTRDEALSCLGEIDQNDTSFINITSHATEERIDRELRAKYGEAYTSPLSCDTIQVYESDYRVWMLFRKDITTGKYLYCGYDQERDAALHCAGTVNILIDEISVSEHSALEQLIDSVENYEMMLIGYEQYQCNLISCYDFVTNKYLIFGVKDGKGYYACCVDYLIPDACHGTLDADSATIYIDAHGSSWDSVWDETVE